MPVVIGPPNYSPQDQVFRDYFRQLQEQMRLEEERKRQEEAQDPGWQGGLQAVGTIIGSVVGGPTGGMIGSAAGSIGDIGMSYAMPGGGGGGGGPSAVVPRVNQGLGRMGQFYAASQMQGQRQQAAMQMAQQRQQMQQATSVNRTMESINAEAPQVGMTGPEYLNYLMGDKQLDQVMGEYAKNYNTLSPHQRQLVDNDNALKAGVRHIREPGTSYAPPHIGQHMQESLMRRRRIGSEIGTSPPPELPTVPGQLKSGQAMLSDDGSRVLSVDPKTRRVTTAQTGDSYETVFREHLNEVAKRSDPISGATLSHDEAVRIAAKELQAARIYQDWQKHLKQGGNLGFDAFLVQQAAQQAPAPVGVPMGAPPAPGPVVTPAQMPPMAPGGGQARPMAPAPAGGPRGPGQMPRPQAAQVVQARLDDPQSVPPNVFIDAVRSLFPNPKDVPGILKDEIRRIHAQQQEFERAIPDAGDLDAFDMPVPRGG